MKYEAVIFDLFGTLVNSYSYEGYLHIFRMVASNLGVPLEDFRKLWSETAPMRALGTISSIEANMKRICEQLGVECDEGQIEFVTKYRNDFIARTMTPQEDAFKVLTRIKSMGLKTGLISNCSLETPSLFSGLPFAGLFDTTVFSCSVGMQKPDPRIYELAVKQMFVKPEKCLYVGDGSGKDLTVERNAGMNPVLIRHDGEDGTQLHLADREEIDSPRISRLSEILPMLEEYG
jgi:putative hydrolase of the HAD superfamily